MEQDTAGCCALSTKYIIVGGLSFFLLFYKIKFKSFDRLAVHSNNLIPCIIIAQIFGRIGCFLGGCCYGLAINTPISVRFPNHANESVLPTQLLEVGLLIIVYFLLLYKYNKNKTTFYLLFYGIGRFMIEFLRGDNRGFLFYEFLSPSQYLCIILIIISTFNIIRISKNKAFET